MAIPTTIGEKAFLDILAYAEGTYGVGTNQGYDVLLSTTTRENRLIKGWTPDTTINHQLVKWRVPSVDSNAAGRYQFIGSTWRGVLGTNQPMTKDNQDYAALKYLKQIFASHKTTIYSNLIQGKINDVSDMIKITQILGGPSPDKAIWASFNAKANGGFSPETLFGWYQIVYRKYNNGLF